MPRAARIVRPGRPHHVTQRGVRAQQTFFDDADYRAYLVVMAESCALNAVACWAYCLMPNHVHLILVPEDEAGLARAVSRAHRLYTVAINRRFGVGGHLWQGRFYSDVLDERHLFAAARYVEQNPVRAGLAQAPYDWRWSSARAHLSGKDDMLVRVRPMLERVQDWDAYLGAMDSEDVELMRR